MSIPSSGIGLPLEDAAQGDQIQKLSLLSLLMNLLGKRE
jgi:hypothetical protein